MFVSVKISSLVLIPRCGCGKYSSIGISFLLDLHHIGHTKNPEASSTHTTVRPTQAQPEILNDSPLRETGHAQKYYHFLISKHEENTISLISI